MSNSEAKEEISEEEDFLDLGAPPPFPFRFYPDPILAEPNPKGDRSG